MTENTNNENIVEDTPEHIQRMSAWEKFKEWFYGLFTDTFEVTIWYAKEVHTTDKQKTVTYSKPKIYMMKSISKKTQTHLKGVDINGHPLEIKTTHPFNFNIRQLN